jgi:hypothetical protein
MARSARVPPAEPRRRAGRLVAAASAVALGLLAAFFLLRDGAPPPDESRASAQASPVPPPPPRPLTPTEIADPEEAHRAAVKLEQVTRFEAMRSAFEGGRRDTPASRERLDPALRALWPARPATYRLACREAVCRVDLPAPLEASRGALAADPGVRAVADGVFLDPDGVDPAGYVLLAAVTAAPGQGILSEVEREFSRSTEARECLSRVGAVGAVEYELKVDGSGFTYRTRTDLPREVQECVEAVLNGIITATALPPEVKTASVTLALRR